MWLFRTRKMKQTDQSVSQDRSAAQIEKDMLGEDILLFGNIIAACAKDFYRRRECFSGEALTSMREQLRQLKELMLRQLETPE